jgi:molybdopterin converting factor small subunit
MAKDTRRVAVGGLPTQCSVRGRLGRLAAGVVQAHALNSLSLETVVDAQVASLTPNPQVACDKEGMIVPVTFHIPGALREFTAGRSKVEIERSPTTLADALAALWTLYPGVRDRIATEQGQVRQHINIFIGDENVRYTGGLASLISPGSEISIVPAVSGG